MKENKKKTTLGRSILNMFGGLFSNSYKDVDNDALLSPGQQIKRNFFENKLGVTGLITFILIFVIVFGGTTFGPAYDEYEHDTPLQNLSPGKNFLKVDKKLKNPVKIESGVSYSVALDEEGKVYFWGKNPGHRMNVDEIIEMTEGKTIVDIASGERHVIALTNTGDIIGTGLNSFYQADFTSEIKQRLVGDKVVKIGAHSSYSVVLTEKGNLYVWGSTNANNLNSIPRDYQGRIVDFAVAPFNMILTLDDGTVVGVGIRGSELVTTIPEKLQDGSTNIVKVVTSETGALALDDQGHLHGWGRISGTVLTDIEQLDSPVVKISSNLKTFYALTEEGHVHTLGSAKYGLSDIPSNVEKQHTKDIFSAYYSAYAVDEDGNINAWGLEGFILGSDGFGRDVATRLLHGGRISLTVGAVAIIISLIIGVIVGLLAGFYGGVLDNVLMRFAEVVSAFPFMPLAITLSSLMPVGTPQNTRLLMIMVILGVISWPGVARLVRGQILAEREKDFVLAARALGLKERTVIIKHILPSVFNLIIVNMTLGYASSLLTEAGLSYLGFGVRPPSPSWGNMLNGVVNSIVIERYWWQWLLPAGSVLIAALSVNLIGDALRDAMDPRSIRN